MNIRIAKVIDDYKIVINKGSNNGIQVGQRLLVYAIGEEINDPESGESLGQLEIVKGTGVVTHVQEYISTVESDRKSKSFRKIIRKPLLAFQLAGEEEIINPSETIPFDEPKVGDLVKGI
ncbi:MAG TPA: hypothetical protein DGG95_12795 [Cytophagales bacterium]|jgi:hypothetical protein|nr:hypothetical protein [Cytophagales bacterium]